MSDATGYLHSAEWTVQYPPPNGAAFMLFEVKVRRPNVGSASTVTIQEIGRRKKDEYTTDTFDSDDVLPLVKTHVESNPLPKVKRRSKKERVPTVTLRAITYHVVLPGTDKQGRPKLCQVDMFNSPLCLGQEPLGRDLSPIWAKLIRRFLPKIAPPPVYDKTWEERMIYDPRPCHAEVCRRIEQRRGARNLSFATDSCRLDEAISAAKQAESDLDWR